MSIYTGRKTLCNSATLKGLDIGLATAIQARLLGAQGGGAVMVTQDGRAHVLQIGPITESVSEEFMR